MSAIMANHGIKILYPGHFFGKNHETKDRVDNEITICNGVLSGQLKGQDNPQGMMPSQYSISGFTFKANASTGITLPNLFNLQLLYNYFGKQYTSQGTVKPQQSLDIGVSKQFFDNKLTVLFKANDVFKTMENNSFISGAGFTQNNSSSYNSRVLMLTLTYNFGQTDKKDMKKKPKNNNNDNIIMDEGQ